MNISRLKSVILVAAITAVVVGVSLSAPARPLLRPTPPPAPGRVRLDSIRVTFRPGSTVTERDAVIHQVGGQLYLFDERSRTAQIVVHPRQNEHELLDLIRELETFPAVEYAAPEVPLKFD